MKLKVFMPLVIMSIFLIISQVNAESTLWTCDTSPYAPDSARELATGNIYVRLSDFPGFMIITPVGDILGIVSFEDEDERAIAFVDAYPGGDIIILTARDPRYKSVGEMKAYLFCESSLALIDSAIIGHVPSDYAAYNEHLLILDAGRHSFPDDYGHHLIALNRRTLDNIIVHEFETEPWLIQISTSHNRAYILTAGGVIQVFDISNQDCNNWVLARTIQLDNTKIVSMIDFDDLNNILYVGYSSEVDSPDGGILEKIDCNSQDYPVVGSYDFGRSVRQIVVYPEHNLVFCTVFRGSTEELSGIIRFDTLTENYTYTECGLLPESTAWSEDRDFVSVLFRNAWGTEHKLTVLGVDGSEETIEVEEDSLYPSCCNTSCCNTSYKKIILCQSESNKVKMIQF